MDRTTGLDGRRGLARQKGVDLQRTFRLLPVTVFACLVLATAPGVAADPRIGVASAVSNQVEGRGARALTTGSEVYANERIKTGEAAKAQFMFLDKTVLSLGPKAELVLDKFVYDPNKGTGQVAVNALQGTFRFVTGAQNPNNYTIKTPVATLGIRGTVLDLVVQKGQMAVLLIEGAVTIRMKNGQTVQLTKPGTAMTVGANGQASGPVPWDGTVMNIVAGGATLPLYGLAESSVTQAGGSAIDKLQAIDQLNAIAGRSYVPPPVQPPGSPGGPGGPGGPGSGGGCWWYPNFCSGGL